MPCNILAGKSVSFTGAIFAEQYQSILDIGRKKLHFRTDYSYRDFEGNPRELLFIQNNYSQLMIHKKMIQIELRL